MALSQAQIDQLNSAALKTDKTATDIANIDYATKNYGYTAPTTAAPAFTVPTGYERVDNVASLPNYSTTIKDPNSVAIYGIPKQQSVGDLGNNNPIVPAPTPTVPTDMNSFVSGLKGGQTSATNLGDIMNLTSPEVQTATQQNQGLTQKLLDQLSKLTGRSQQTEELTVKAGIPEAQKQLADLNVQIAQKTANFDKALVDEQGKPILNAIIGGRTSLIQRQKAVELGGLSAVAQAMQGNISAAQNTIKETVQMEYQDQLDQIDSLKTQLEVNRQAMTDAQKELADKQSILLNERTRVLAEQATERSNVLSLATTAATNGAPASVTSAMSKATTIADALSLGGKYLSTQQKVTINDQLNANAAGYNIDTNGNLVSQTAGQVSTSTGDVYDIGSYATDPTHEIKVQSILKNMGQMKSIEEMDAYIKSRYPNSPVTGQMIANAAGKYGVSWEMMMAIMEQDSSFGTAGKAVRTFNPGNVGNTDSGATANYGNWQAGVDAVAKNLAWRKVEKTATNGINNEALNVILGSGKFTKDQTAAIKNSIQNGEDPYIVIKNQAKQLLSGTNQTEVEKYEVIAEQLNDLDSLMKDYYANGGKTNLFTGNIEKTINKLGEVKDPKLVSIAVNIASSLQAYRNAISGTAYSEQEGKDIASIFPGINKSEGLNAAIIAGRLAFVNNTIDSKYRGVLGSVYDKLKPTTDSNQPVVTGTTSSGIGWTIEK